MTRLFDYIARYFHWSSLLLVVVMDWLIFVKEVFVAVTIMGPVVLALLGGLLTGAIVGVIQRKVERDSGRQAVVKGLLTAVVIGIPTPTVGTLLMGGGGLLKLGSLLAVARKRRGG